LPKDPILEPFKSKGTRASIAKMDTIYKCLGRRRQTPKLLSHRNPSATNSSKKGYVKVNQLICS